MKIKLYYVSILLGQDILFVTHLNGEEGNRAEFMRWGLIPFWAKDKKIGASCTNARAESVADKPAFRQSFKSKRGIVVMSGFFEWQDGTTPKQPYYFKKRDGELLAIAALWDRWQSPEGEAIETCTLITTSANDLMKPIHERMPVLIDADSRAFWLDNTHCDAVSLLRLLKPYPNTDLMCYPVTTLMNNPRFDVHQAIEPRDGA